jgi:hypothetical protein
MEPKTLRTERSETGDASVLMAILVAARKTKDRALEQVAKRDLEERHGIKISFTRQRELEVTNA